MWAVLEQGWAAFLLAPVWAVCRALLQRWLNREDSRRSSFQRPPRKQALVELINTRRPMGTEVLKHAPVPRLMEAEEEGQGLTQEARRRAYTELYREHPEGGFRAALLLCRLFWDVLLLLLLLPGEACVQPRRRI